GKVKEQVLLIVMRDMAHLHSTDARTIEERSAGAPESGSVLGPALYLLAKHLAAVRDIQKRYADRRFQSTATRMEAGAERYIGAVKAGATRTLVHIERDARTFLTVLSQYERLHAIALDESTERLRKDWKNLLYVLFLPLAALLLPGLAVVGWLFRLIDRALDRQGRAEAKVRELNLTLERRVEERTAELRQANEELLRKERLAALGQLTATVAHELRNPLGTIRTSFAVVNRQAGAAEGMLRRALDRIERNIGRCDRIISELLDFTRVRELKSVPTPVDSWLADFFREYAMPPQVAVSRQPRAPGAFVCIDRDQFRRALVNVTDNACQAMGDDGDGAGRLTVATRQADDGVEITITDTGPGMTADVMARVFEPLYSTKGFGVGLGLPTVKQIMERHGGGIEFVSKEGVGTQAVLWLPLCPDREGVTS
ncbi:MAG: ATP-binding protein, partial [Rhodospirillales bacterium]|nr:ATP-binding protein [Rhodospirillales bacterium]